MDELRVVDEASSSVFEEPPPPNTALNPPGLIPSTKPGLSFPPKKCDLFILVHVIENAAYVK